MSKEVPEYKRRSQVQPSAELTREPKFSEEMHGGTQASLNTAELGAKIAQNMAQERAVKYAIEDANKNPGKKLLPALTESDTNYNKIYREEEGQVIQFRGNQLLRKLYEDLNKIPNLNANHLLQYEKNAKNGINELLSISNESNRNELSRRFESSYEGFFYDLSNKVNANNQKFIIDQLGARSKQAAQDMDDANRNNDPKRADDNYNQLLINMYKEADFRNWPEETVRQKEKEIKAKAEQSKLQGEYTRTPEQDKPNFIASIREKTAETLSPTSQDQVVLSVMQFAAQYDAALQGQQYINYSNLLTKLNQGALTQSDIDTAVNDGQINANQIADLSLKEAKSNAREFKLNILSDQMTGDFGSVVGMSKYTDKEVDTVFNKYLSMEAKEKGMSPDSVPLTAQIQFAENIKAPVSSLKDKVERALKGGNVPVAADAVRAHKYASDSGSLTLDGLNNEADAIGRIANKLMMGGSPVEEAILKAREQVLKKNDATNAQLLNDFNSKTGPNSKNKNLNDINQAYKYAANVCDFKKSELPPGFVDIFAEQLKSNYIVAGGDLQIAENITKHHIRKTYGETSVNGFREVMYLPPDKFAPHGAGDIDDIKIDIIEQMKKEFEKGKNAFDNGTALVWYEFSNEYDLSQVNKSIKVIRHDSFGESEKGNLVISSDTKTGNPEQGITPNYAVELDIDGLRAPISFSENPYLLLRYQMNFDKLNEKYAPTPEKVDKFNLFKEKSREISRQLEEDILENQYE